MDATLLTAAAAGAAYLATPVPPRPDRVVSDPTAPGGSGETTDVYQAALRQARQTFPSATGLIDAWRLELELGRRVYGAVPGHDEVPYWSTAECVEVEKRWLDVLTVAQVTLLAGGLWLHHDVQEATATYKRVVELQTALEDARSWHALMSGVFDRDPEVAQQAFRTARRVPILLEQEGAATEGTGPSRWEEVAGGITGGLAGALGATGRALGSLGGGLLGGLASSPAGVLVLVGGGYLLYRRLAP